MPPIFIGGHLFCGFSGILTGSYIVRRRFKAKEWALAEINEKGPPAEPFLDLLLRDADVAKLAHHQIEEVRPGKAVIATWPAGLPILRISAAKSYGESRADTGPRTCGQHAAMPREYTHLPTLLVQVY